MSHFRAGLLIAAAAALPLCCAAPDARAQTVTQTNGPDIIVCSFPDVSNNTPAAVNGIMYDSFCVGTTSANRGNTPVNWWTGNGENRHPAISQNIFRYIPSQGRFEQLGQGSLKHGFTALQDNDCASPNYFNFGCSATAGTTLGVGCADPYCCGLNNVTGSGGPKWQVNAATGLFPYPISNTYQAQSGPPRVRLADLNAAPAGSRYFMEGQYIVGDDAAAGNKYNNATWQEVTMTPTGTMPNATDFTIALTGQVHREKCAIYAWQVIDPAVTITTIDVPNDGRFILAYKVTGPVSGLYTYEYALQNMNSDRCAGTFTVPLPGTQNALSGIGFHDVECVAEPNATPANAAADDWSVAGGSANASNVVWSGPAFSGTPAIYTQGAQPYQVGTFTAGTGNNHTANVLRWGTTFNFRFTSEVAPAAGTIGVGLWRPGVGSSFTMAASTPGGSMAVGGDLVAICCLGGSCSVASQAACAGGSWGVPGASCSPNPCAVGTCCSAGACTQSVISDCTGHGVWTVGGSCSPNNCPPPSGACCASSSCTVLAHSACASGYQGDDTTCATAPCPPANDLCANAFWVAANIAVGGNTTAATNSGGNDVALACGQATGSPDVWYKYRPVTAGAITVSLCGSSYDTTVSAHSGNCGALTQIVCNDDSCGLSSSITFTGVANTTYYIRITGYQGSTGVFTFTVTGGGGVIPAGACCNATACTSTTQAACPGAFQGAETVCGPVGNPTTCCKANFNQVNGVTVQDIFDFLTAWFANDPHTDYNGVNGVTVQDIFDFLGGWFSGC